MYVIPYVMGPIGSPLGEGGGRADRQRLRRPEHADHDPHGAGAPCEDARRRRRLQPRPPLRRSTWIPSAASSATSRRTTRSGRSGAATAATSSSGRSASRSGSARYLGRNGGLDGRAHAHHGGREPEGRDDLRRRRVPERLREDELRHAHPAARPDRAGRSGRSATTSPGCVRDPTDASGRSTPRRATSAWPPGRTTTRTPTRWQPSRKDTLYTNVAMTPDGDVWWEGKDGAGPGGADRLARPPLEARLQREGRAPEQPFHRPGRRNNPALSPSGTTRSGVPISAIIFGGRRSTTVPLVSGVQLDARRLPRRHDRLGDDRRGRPGKVGVVRRDPMAMLPFCGYDMGHYFGHWLEWRERIPSRPKIFIVNWFRKDDDGAFLWPGFGENMRVLEVDRRPGPRPRRRLREPRSAGCRSGPTSTSRTSPSRSRTSRTRRRSTTRSGSGSSTTRTVSSTS